MIKTATVRHPIRSPIDTSSTGQTNSESCQLCQEKEVLLHGRSCANRRWSKASMWKDRGSQSASNFPLPFLCPRDNTQKTLWGAGNRDVRDVSVNHVQGTDKFFSYYILWRTQTLFLPPFQRTADKSLYWGSRCYTWCRNYWCQVLIYWNSAYELSEGSVSPIPEFIRVKHTLPNVKRTAKVLTLKRASYKPRVS